MKRRNFIREIVLLSAMPTLLLPRKSVCATEIGVVDLALLHLPAAGGGTPFTFGYTSAGGLSASSTRVITCAFACGTSGTLQSISCYGKLVSGSGNVAAAIYQDNAGTPGTIVAQSAGTTAIDTTPAWRTVSLSASVTSGTTYWLAMWGDSSMTYYYESDAAYSVKLGQNTGFHEFNPYSNNSTSPSRRASVYANCTT